MLITEEPSCSIGKGSAQYHLQKRKNINIYISFLCQRTSPNLYNLHIKLKYMQQSFKGVQFNETIHNMFAQHFDMEASNTT